MSFARGDTMRIAIFALVVLGGVGAAEAAQIEVISSSPRHFEIAASCWPGGWNCQQEASDFAQGYCHGQFVDNPRRAILVGAGRVERASFGERATFVFRCSRRPIVCEAGSC
jgi:hypothetical protein